MKQKIRRMKSILTNPTVADSLSCESIYVIRGFSILPQLFGTGIFFVTILYNN